VSLSLLSLGGGTSRVINVSAVLTYTGLSAIAIGVSQGFSYYFVSFINASSLFGRFFAGSICDRYGESF